MNIVLSKRIISKKLENNYKRNEALKSDKENDKQYVKWFAIPMFRELDESSDREALGTHDTKKKKILQVALNT
ncbi:29995_t:CDS:2 [Gigaspora margarita]|uniref:29995_t:CDS:1 n=1 Tax=Gigaspora margarita TaxID=4874 RepID=A0ABN7UGE1_GIGMA|nr:29995_t:CDS:2 [Gigaspora margarita]